jgi:peptidyl-prolyl cis-trans isomerase C
MAEEDVGQNPQLQAMPPEARRDYMVSYLADVILAAKAAEGKKVADQKEFKGRLAFIRNKLLMETLLQQEGKAACFRCPQVITHLENPSAQMLEAALPPQ